MLRKMADNEFDKVYSIIEKSFPVDEYRPYEEQMELLKHPKYTVYVLPEDTGEGIRAFIAVWQFNSFAFIEHFAVDPKYRNNGLGSIILKEISAMLSCFICLEVEPEDTDFAKRRIEFYKRNGFILNNYPYHQPPISKGKKEIPLMLMTCPKELTKPEFENIKNTLYKEVYRLL